MRLITWAILWSGAQAFVVVPSATRPVVSSSSSAMHAFGDFFKPKQQQQQATIPEFEPVTIDPDFGVTAAFLAGGLVLDVVPYVQFLLGLPITLLGILFLVQTFRLRFCFTEDNSLELVTVNPLSGAAGTSGENVVVGGANKWSCDTIVNYDFFPSIDSPGPVVLIYFKETQTDPATWNEGPGKSANDPAKIEAGTAVAGQVHFFPAICNSKQLQDEFVKRNCGTL